MSPYRKVMLAVFFLWGFLAVVSVRHCAAQRTRTAVECDAGVC